MVYRLNNRYYAAKSIVIMFFERKSTMTMWNLQENQHFIHCIMS